ncbi:MAG: RIO1 family regulatory kinase/ATPase, partial [Pseudomonadota bacterium]
PDAPHGRLAAKVYRDRRFRAFANNADYADAGRIRDRRLAKAVRKGSRRGRRESQRLWVEREWEALVALKQAGASVPRAVDHNDVAVLMEFLGDDSGPAPLLAECRLQGEALQGAWLALRQDLALLLLAGFVHGDLSPYNVLYCENRPRMIDLPQAIAVDDLSDSWSLFHRDVENVAGYFQRQGLEIDVLQEAVGLWERYAL